MSIKRSDAKAGVTEVLSILSSYSQSRIIEIIDFSDDTELQLIMLMSADQKDTLAFRIHEKFPALNQKSLYKALFNTIKTAEKLIDYVIKNG